MKLLLALALVFSFGGAVHNRTAPVIVSQKTDTIPDDLGSLIWERTIAIHNPLDRAAWVFLECSSHLTTNAIGLAGRHTSTFVFPDIPPEEKCWINHWLVQPYGVSPPEWHP